MQGIREDMLQPKKLRKTKIEFLFFLRRWL